MNKSERLSAFKLQNLDRLYIRILFISENLDQHGGPYVFGQFLKVGVASKWVKPHLLNFLCFLCILMAKISENCEAILDVTKNISYQLLKVSNFMNFSLELNSFILSHPGTSKQPHKIVQILMGHPVELNRFPIFLIAIANHPNDL